MISRADILVLMRERGGLAYDGEGVTQLQHGWQCALLARRARAPATLQVAAWLHDVGHLLSGLPGSPTLAGIDDAHEMVGSPLLGRLFGAAVGDPVALHVEAKRYLVATRPDYRAMLSADSLRSLVLQGGPMNTLERTRFIALPQAREAIRLRIWDDHAKSPAQRPASDDEALAELTALMASVPAPAP